MRWFSILFLTTIAFAQTPAEKIGAVLDDWHQAAAAADFNRYFSHFSANGVFLGTDGTERWTVPEFRAYAKPHFDRKKAWSFQPHSRHIDFAPGGAVAWFDEALDTPNLGPARGSGVLVLQNGIWKIAQYNLSIPIPNELEGEIVKLVAAKR